MSRSRKEVPRLQAWGQMFAAAPLIREIKDGARERVGRGLSEAEVRAWILERGEKEGIAGARTLLPSLSRKILRMELRKLLHAAVDHFMDRSRARTVGDLVKKISKQVGWDEWFVDFVLEWAKSDSDEPGAYMEHFKGRVFENTMTVEGEKWPTVWVIATPASDPDALIEEFVACCVRVLPTETWKRHRSSPVEGARFFRWFQEGKKDSEIAWLSLGEKYPEIKALSGKARAEYKPEHRRETERVKKARRRWDEYGTKVVSAVSPDSSQSPLGYLQDGAILEVGGGRADEGSGRTSRPGSCGARSGRNACRGAPAARSPSPSGRTGSAGPERTTK